MPSQMSGFTMDNLGVNFGFSNTNDSLTGLLQALIHASVYAQNKMKECLLCDALINKAIIEKKRNCITVFHPIPNMTTWFKGKTA